VSLHAIVALVISALLCGCALPVRFDPVIVYAHDGVRGPNDFGGRRR